MKSNMGSIDKVVRIVIAIALIGLYFGGFIVGTLGIIALVVAGVFLLTSFVSFCPLYAMIGVNTCKKKI